MSYTLFHKPGDFDEHQHFLSPPPEVSGGIATPERSKAERDVPRASSGHCTAYTVLGSDSGTETQGESLLEINHLFVLNTVPNVVELREQVRFYYGWDPKKLRQHIFDVGRSLDDWRAHRFRDQARVPAQLFKPGEAGFRG